MNSSKRADSCSAWSESPQPTTEAGRIELRVSDSGIGIPPEQLPRLFERFHRIQGTRGRTQEGSGIGLALVQELVKLHGGTLQVESKPGHGSTFSVSLPAGRAHLPDERVREPRAMRSTAVSGELYVAEALRWLPDAETDSASELRLARYAPEFVPAEGLTQARVLIVDDNAAFYLRAGTEAPGD